jgi:hypothetical protein
VVTGRRDRQDTAVSVSACLQGFSSKPLDGDDKCAIEGQSPSKVSGGLLLERICLGQGALESMQGFLKLRNPRFGATRGAHLQGL